MFSDNGEIAAILMVVKGKTLSAPPAKTNFIFFLENSCVQFCVLYFNSILRIVLNNVKAYNMHIVAY